MRLNFWIPCCALVSLFFLVAVGWFVMSFFSSNRLVENIRVSIEPGQGINRISKELYDSGAIKNTFVFETVVWLMRKEGNFQAGVYEIPAHATISEIVRRMTSGEVSAKENDLTLIEGWSQGQIAAEVERQTNVSAESFLEASQRIQNEDYDFLVDRPEGEGLEGFLFPDTYRVYRQTSAEEILKKLLQNFDQKLNSELRTKISERGKSIFDIVTLASILEREVKSLEDKKNASDVFWKRLAAGIALQSDATVNYATGKSSTAANAEDLMVDSLYNTYRYPGLPPGPISNPGLDSLVAALDPRSNDYFYFLTTPRGRAVFSRTLEEHNQNKLKFLK